MIKSFSFVDIMLLIDLFSRHISVLDLYIVYYMSPNTYNWDRFFSRLGNTVNSSSQIGKLKGIE